MKKREKRQERRKWKKTVAMQLMPSDRGMSVFLPDVAPLPTPSVFILSNLISQTEQDCALARRERERERLYMIRAGSISTRRRQALIFPASWKRWHGQRSRSSLCATVCAECVCCVYLIGVVKRLTRDVQAPLHTL